MDEFVKKAGLPWYASIRATPVEVWVRPADQIHRLGYFDTEIAYVPTTRENAEFISNQMQGAFGDNQRAEILPDGSLQFYGLDGQPLAEHHPEEGPGRIHPTTIDTDEGPISVWILQDGWNVWRH